MDRHPKRLRFQLQLSIQAHRSDRKLQPRKINSLRQILSKALPFSKRWLTDRPSGHHDCGLVAQSVEQCPEKACVGGSIPSQPTIFIQELPTNIKMFFYCRPRVVQSFTYWPAAAGSSATKEVFSRSLNFIAITCLRVVFSQG